jgi:hypothetical protein
MKERTKAVSLNNETKDQQDDIDRTQPLTQSYFTRKGPSRAPNHKILKHMGIFRSLLYKYQHLFSGKEENKL